MPADAYQPTGFAGPWRPNVAGSDANALDFIIRAITSGFATTKLVKVTKVTLTGLVAPAGLLDVQPLVQMVDGAGNSYSHGTIHNVPFFRLLSGTNAIIIDPQIGDVGFAVFADRDSSGVKMTQREGPPGSNRMFDMADGIYVGGILGAAPTQYIRFHADGIFIHSPVKVTVDAPQVLVEATETLTLAAPTIYMRVDQLNGENYSGGTSTVSWRGSFAAEGTVTAGDGTGDSVTMQNHRHGGGPPPDPGT